jgi:hypothetical protein
LKYKTSNSHLFCLFANMVPTSYATNFPMTQLHTSHQCSLYTNPHTATNAPFSLLLGCPLPYTASPANTPTIG